MSVALAGGVIIVRKPIRIGNRGFRISVPWSGAGGNLIFRRRPPWTVGEATFGKRSPRGCADHSKFNLVK